MIGESYPHLDQDKFAVMAMELIEKSPNSNGWYCIGFSPRKVRIYTGAYGLRMREAIGIMPRIRYRYRWPGVA